MGQAGPATGPTQPAGNQNLAFLQQYGQNPNAATGKAEPTRKLTPQEQVEAAQASERMGAARQGPNIPEPPAIPGTEIPIKTIETHTGQIPGFFSSLPEPKSLIFPLLVIVVFWILIIKVNGKSRFQWLWEVLGGLAVVTPTASTDQNFQGATGNGQTINPVIVQPPISDPVLVNALTNNDNSVVTDITNGSTFNPSPWLTTPSGSIAVTGGPV